jgi:hypothetical protein
MLAGMNLPPDPADDRRTVPRHLRDSEHQAAPGTAGAGLRREDVPVRRTARGTVLLLVAGAALGAGWWLGATVPLGVACLAVAVVAGVFASLSFLRR